MKSRIESGKELNGYLAKWDDDQTFVHANARAICLKNLDTGLIQTFGSFLEASQCTGIWRGTLKKYIELKEPYKNWQIYYAKK